MLLKEFKEQRFRKSSAGKKAEPAPQTGVAGNGQPNQERKAKADKNEETPVQV